MIVPMEHITLLCKDLRRILAETGNYEALTLTEAIGDLDAIVDAQIFRNSNWRNLNA